MDISKVKVEDGVAFSDEHKELVIKQMAADNKGYDVLGIHVHEFNRGVVTLTYSLLDKNGQIWPYASKRDYLLWKSVDEIMDKVTDEPIKKIELFKHSITIEDALEKTDAEIIRGTSKHGVLNEIQLKLIHTHCKKVFVINSDENSIGFKMQDGSVIAYKLF